jgi:hypothetical protein
VLRVLWSASGVAATLWSLFLECTAGQFPLATQHARHCRFPLPTTGRTPCDHHAHCAVLPMSWHFPSWSLLSLCHTIRHLCCDVPRLQCPMGCSVGRALLNQLVCFAHAVPTWHWRCHEERSARRGAGECRLLVSHGIGDRIRGRHAATQGAHQETGHSPRWPSAWTCGCPSDRPSFLPLLCLKHASLVQKRKRPVAALRPKEHAGASRYTMPVKVRLIPVI